MHIIFAIICVCMHVYRWEQNFTHPFIKTYLLKHKLPWSSEPYELRPLLTSRLARPCPSHGSDHQGSLCLCNTLLFGCVKFCTRLYIDIDNMNGKTFAWLSFIWSKKSNLTLHRSCIINLFLTLRESDFLTHKKKKVQSCYVFSIGCKDGLDL